MNEEESAAAEPVEEEPVEEEPVEEEPVEKEKQLITDFSEFLIKHDIKPKDWADWLLQRSQKEFDRRLKTAGRQFWVIVAFLACVVGSLLWALLTDKIVSETFTGIVGIITGYMFYMIKYSAISPIRRREEL